MPQKARLAGAAALVHELGVAAPVRRPACVADQHVSASRRTDGVWTVFDSRYRPGDELADELELVLKHEDAHLLDPKSFFTGKPRLS